MSEITNEQALSYIDFVARSRSKIMCKVCEVFTLSTDQKIYMIAHVKKHLIAGIRNRPIAVKHSVAVPDPSPVPEAVEEDFSQIVTPSRRFECIFLGCGKRFESTSELNRHEVTHSSETGSLSQLKSYLIDEQEGLFFVRVTDKGQDFKIHVNVKSGYCEHRACNVGREDGSTLICRHIRSARSGNYSDCEFFNLTEEMVESTKFSEHILNNLRHLQDEADFNLKPFIAESSESKQKSRHFSVYESKTERAYVKLTIDGDRNCWKCSFCSKEVSTNCLHIHACMIACRSVLEYVSNPDLGEENASNILKKYAQ